MIKTIKQIKNFGVFSSFNRDGNLNNFKEKNIIYGWNYSGKTTLSRLLSFLDKDSSIPEEYRDVEFQIELDDGTIITDKNRDTSPVLIKVFNSDFIRKNLHFDTEDEKIAGIKFSVGNVGEIQKQIRTTEAYIAKAQKIITRNKQNITLYNAFDNQFTTLARSISEMLSYGRSFNKSDIWRYIDSWNQSGSKYEDFIITPSNIEAIKLNATAQKSGTIIDISHMPQTRFEELQERVKLLLLKEPTQTTENDLLSSNRDLYNWANTGLAIYQRIPHLTKCAFCGSDISDGKAIKELNAFYSNEAAKVKSDIEALKQDINTEIRTFQSLEWSRKSVNDLAKSCQEEYHKAIEDYSQLHIAYSELLNQLLSKLDEKYFSHLFEAIELNIGNTQAINALNLWIESVKNIFSRSNEIITNFETTQAEAKKKYKCHLIAQYLIDNKFSEIARKKEIEEKGIAKINTAITSAETRKKQLQAQLDSIDKGCRELEDFIKIFLSRNDISVETTQDNYFILKRNDQIAKHLSDGEKTAIALSHFFVLLKSLKDDNKLKDYIIFIDDPISSLDANHIAQVSSLINTFFFEKGLDITKPDKVCNCFTQLFISTHNFEFFSFLRDANNIKRKRKEVQNGKQVDVPTCNHYMIKKLSISESTIINIPASLTKYNSEYVYLFSEIEKFKEEGFPEERMYMMPNIVRRFLEIYTLMKLPGNTDEIDNRIKLLFPNYMRELKILHNFSHFTSFNRILTHSELVLKMPEIIDDLYVILKKDPTHLKSLQDGIKS